MKSFPLHNAHDRIRQKNTEKIPNAHSILNSLKSSNSLALNTRNVLNSLKSDDDKSGDEYDDDSNIDNLLLNIPKNKNVTLSNENSSLFGEIINHSISPFNDLDLDETLNPYLTNESLSNVDGHTYGDINHTPIISGNENGLPGPPRDLVAYIVKTRFVTLKWSEPEETNGNILGYSVYYRLQGSQRLDHNYITKHKKHDEMNVFRLNIYI